MRPDHTHLKHVLTCTPQELNRRHNPKNYIGEIAALQLRILGNDEVNRIEKMIKFIIILYSEVQCIMTLLASNKS